MANTWAPCLALSCLLGIGSGLPAAAAQDATPTPARTPVVIDSDMISDDWMATLYVLNNPQFDVKAITVTGAGFADCEAGVRAALGILALTGHTGVPVSCGSEDPLVGTNAPPADWMTTIETVEALGLPEGGEAAEADAVALFTSTIQEADGPVTVLALGPLTNIASALEATPALVDDIAMMYVMGGAVDVDGSFVSDANTSAEWNIYSDPHAARLVFESGVPITLVPLDATNEAPVTPEFVARLEAEKATPAAEFVATLLENNAESIASGSYYFWDPLAAVVLGDPGLVTLTPRNVTVVDSPGDPEDGRTKPVSDGPEILVATAPDGEALEAALLEAWNR
ncbi:MAG: nucleoside hydrolase [Thermomicrobiales bacterium]|nr:nucleoside hydrolase [Thermomicrobiales bacterium]